MAIISFLITLIIVPSFLFSLTHKQKQKLIFYNPVMTELSDIASKQRLKQLFLNKRIRFNSRLILLNLDQPSQEKYFAASLRDKVLKKGAKFLKKYKKTFEQAEKLYSVDKEIIVAVLYIETNFNLKTAKYNVFNAYVNLSFANHPYYVKLNLKRLKKKYKKLSKKEFAERKKKFLKRGKKKSKWAIKQLKALFKVAKQMKRSVLNIKGSFAGAMGYPQFIPTSYLSYAVDGDNDNLIDLYNIKDSIVSIGNYLKTEGFKQTDVESQKNAIHHYNNNWEYVQFVLEYAKRLKKM